MGRPAKFDADQILDAAAALAADGGAAAVTVTAIAARLGAPSGSIYHRYGSRELLLAHLWIRTVRRFQEGFLPASEGDDLAAAVRRAASYTVRWAAEHPAEARLLLDQDVDSLRSRWPEDLGAELSRLNVAAMDAMRRLAGLAGHAELDRVLFALVDIPLAAVRRPLLKGEAIPESATRMVEAAALAVILENVL
ncbi:TetR/AcrR family transcriptional regulator [Spirillospora sp. NPDC048911]|uniref:TetR/AcrR family transcriptional regulator n=1 Tax=Spirillospora sp. NPDC048911 TaxID=3364527 RepID=UPI003717A3C9